MALSLSAPTGHQNELAIVELISIAFRAAPMASIGARH
jgi:hypothetical protein